jgi:hypothetical protein
VVLEHPRDHVDAAQYATAPPLLSHIEKSDEGMARTVRLWSTGSRVPPRLSIGHLSRSSPRLLCNLAHWMAVHTRLLQSFTQLTALQNLT